MRVVVTVVGSDKVGIVAGVATLLAQESANIVDINQTIMSGSFTMMMVVELTESNDFASFKAKLVAEGEKLGVVIHVQNEAIFDAMHKI